MQDNPLSSGKVLANLKSTKNKTNLKSECFEGNIAGSICNNSGSSFNSESASLPQLTMVGSYYFYYYCTTTVVPWLCPSIIIVCFKRMKAIQGRTRGARVMKLPTLPTYYLPVVFLVNLDSLIESWLASSHNFNKEHGMYVALFAGQLYSGVSTARLTIEEAGWLLTFNVAILIIMIGGRWCPTIIVGTTCLKDTGIVTGGKSSQGTSNHTRTLGGWIT